MLPKRRPTPTHDTLVPLFDAEAVAEAAAEIFVASANAAVAETGRFTVALCGGETPCRLYDLLVTPAYSRRVPWDETYVAFVDEHCVPPDHPDSRYRLLRERLLDHVPLAEERVLRIPGENSHPARAAHFYESALRELFPDRSWPAFDLVLLGVGTDGRVASLYPQSDALDEQERWVVANYLSWLGSWCVTLSLPALCQARLTLMLVTGEEKAPIVVKAFGELNHGEPYPCERLVPAHGEREILIDQAAATLLPDPY